MRYRESIKVSDLLGKTIEKIEVGKEKESIDFFTEDSIYTMHHDQDCCEHVSIEDICGDLDDLIGMPILKAEESTSQGENPPEITNPPESQDSFTWTFYHFATLKGYVTIRWYGESNGWYSESVDFEVTDVEKKEKKNKQVNRFELLDFEKE